MKLFITAFLLPGNFRELTPSVSASCDLPKAMKEWKTVAFSSSSLSSSSSSSSDKQLWEEALQDLESEKLYGLASKDAELSQYETWLKKGRLNLFPEYQRDYVWKNDKASRLIATALCNRYIPPVVLHEKSKGTYDVVDGKQRLTSLLGFYLNRSDSTMSLSNKQLTEKFQKIVPHLSTLKALDESYEALQNAFESYSITYAIIPFNTPKADVFEVYEDINSGGMNLTPQQVRRCVYYGPYIQLLDRLAETVEDFHAIRDPANHQKGEYAPCPKHSDREMILRAFAFRKNGDKLKRGLERFFNELNGTDDFDNKDEKVKKTILSELHENEKNLQLS